MNWHIAVLNCGDNSFLDRLLTREWSLASIFCTFNPLCALSPEIKSLLLTRAELTSNIITTGAPELEFQTETEVGHGTNAIFCILSNHWLILFSVFVYNRRVQRVNNRAISLYELLLETFDSRAQNQQRFNTADCVRVTDLSKNNIFFWLLKRTLTDNGLQWVESKIVLR